MILDGDVDEKLLYGRDEDGKEVKVPNEVFWKGKITDIQFEDF